MSGLCFIIIIIIITITIIIIYELNLYNLTFKLGHSQLKDHADLDTTFVSLKSVYRNPKSNVCIGYIYKSASILPSVSLPP